MYMPMDDALRSAPVPAHLVGTRQAIFHLIRSQGARAQRPEPDGRADPAAAPLAATAAVMLRDLLADDRFVF